MEQFDNCATTCECGETHCAKYAAFPMKQNPQSVLHTANGRKVSAEQKKTVEGNLIKYHKSLVMKLVNTLTNLQFMVAFSKLQISQVLDNLERIFEVVEIWDRRHAQQILSVINEIFKDIGDAVQQSYLSAEDGDNQYDFDEFLDECNELLQDDELFDMIMENLSLSQLQLSLVDEEINGSSDLLEDGVPTAVLQTIESMVMDD